MDGFVSQLQSWNEPIHVRATCQPDLTLSSAPDYGHMVARNMLSNY